MRRTPYSRKANFARSALRGNPKTLQIRWRLQKKNRGRKQLQTSK
jgi:hypothetical protein